MFHVYSKPACPHCDQAKALLKAKELPYIEYTLDVGQPKAEGATYVSREDVMNAFPGARTMPQIKLVVDSHEQIIGGFAELRQHLS